MSSDGIFVITPNMGQITVSWSLYQLFKELFPGKIFYRFSIKVYCS